MHYLIDGYNLLFYCCDSKSSLNSQRKKIIRFLQKEFTVLNLEGTIIFDGSYLMGEESGLAYKSPLIIAYSHKGQSADQYILEKLEVSKSPSTCVIVTNDQFLSAQAKGFKARSLSISAFLTQLEKKHQRKKTHQEKPSKIVSQKELDRLVKIFEERFERGEF